MNLNVDTLKDWEKWKETLGKAVNLGTTIGMNESTINSIAFKIGNMLTAAIDPENREERLLQQLWKIGDEEERKVLARLIVKLVELEG
jgi:hypothetical protein